MKKYTYLILFFLFVLFPFRLSIEGDYGNTARILMFVTSALGMLVTLLKYVSFPSSDQHLT